MKTKHYFV